jgi:flagellar hook-associated protein 2
MSTSSSTSSISNLFQPITFGGISQYSSDFQSILTRAQEIDDLPLQSLDTEQTTLQSEVSAAQSLGSTVGGLTSAVQALGALGAKGLVANSSDSNLVTATATGATANATYNITNISSLALAASESSLKGYADTTTTAVSSTGSLSLVVGSTSTPITLASGQNNLTGLENAINNANAGVNAQIITTSSGDYLSVSANNPGTNAISLMDDPTGANTDLLTSQNPGSNTNFDLNGVPISEPSTTISDVVPGMTFSILGTTSSNQTVTVSLSPDENSLSTDLQNLVSAYNAVGQAVNAQVGSGAGALAGNPLVWQTRSAMEQLVNYFDPSNGSIHSLADLGISLDQTGTMSFDASAISSLSASQVDNAMQFLGSATSGLGALANGFDAIGNSVTGAAHSLVTQDNTTLTTLGDQITNLSNTITTNLTSLESQLEAADSSAAQLASQESILTSNINALNYSTYGQSTLSNQGL